MIVFPNAKINFGLSVLRRRSDGYHDLESVFYPVPLCDILEIVIDGQEHKKNATINSNGNNENVIEIPLKSGKIISYSKSGLTINSLPAQDLCVKACMLFDENVGLTGNISMHLHKKIPMGAGLGGGSSDATFVLKTLNILSGEKMGSSKLFQLTAELGSDCSFFVVNAPVIATGRGEIMEPLHLSLAGYQLLIVKPEAHISTKEAFEGITPSEKKTFSALIADEPLDRWKNFVTNDFEENISGKYPVIHEIKKTLYENGALYAAMTGSGSALYGIFKDNVPAKNLFRDCFYFSCEL